jgi:uncharacterized membrane protein YhaH (DUF805 family)
LKNSPKQKTANLFKLRARIVRQNYYRFIFNNLEVKCLFFVQEFFYHKGSQWVTKVFKVFLCVPLLPLWLNPFWFRLVRVRVLPFLTGKTKP